MSRYRPRSDEIHWPDRDKFCLKCESDDYRADSCNVTPRRFLCAGCGAYAEDSEHVCQTQSAASSTNYCEFLSLKPHIKLLQCLPLK